MIKSITLLGSSSGRNAGDAALLSGIMDSIDQTLGRRVVYEIPTIKPNYVWHNYHNKVRPISMLPWAGSVKMFGIPTMTSILRSDLVMIFDAILFDRSLYNPLFNYLSTINVLLPIAKRFNQKLGFYNVGVGPIKTKAGAKMLKQVADIMDFITVRDTESLNLLRECGVEHNRITLTADAALSVAGSGKEDAQKILKQHGLDPQKEILALNFSKYIDTWAQKEGGSMGKEAFVKLASEAITKTNQRLNTQLAFICTQYHDVPLTREIMAKVEGNQPKAIFTNIDYNHYQIKALLAEVSLLLGMRLHATILATAASTPAVALPHQPKVAHYFNRLGLQSEILSFDGFSADGLANALVTAWEKKDQTRAQLDRVMPAMKAQAHYASKFVEAIDKGEDLAPLFKAEA
jgi:polysaccharide pyruvyl transferase WcaK-like protein